MSATETTEDAISATLDEFIASYATKHSEAEAGMLAYVVKTAITLDAVVGALQSGKVQPRVGYEVFDILKAYMNGSCNAISELRGITEAQVALINEAAEHIIVQLRKIAENGTAATA